MYEFIPPDYTKSEETFETLVEKDTESFRPLGERVGSYVRAAAKGKGKAKANGAGVELKEDDEGAVVYEMYKVRSCWIIADGRLRGLHQGSENIIAECSCSSSSLSKEGVMST